jgi:zinc transporter 9
MATGGTKVVVQAIAGNTFITIIKFFGFFITSSPSIMAEAVHSLADTFNQILLLIGLKQSQKKASRNYSTGMGGASYVWNLVSAVGVFFIGFGVTFYHGMHALLEPNHSVTPISWTAIGVLSISFIIEFYVLVGAYKEVKARKGSLTFSQFFIQSDDPALIAVLLEDGAAVVGVVLASIGLILGQVTGSSLFDAIVSLVISFLMAFLAIALGVINGKLLIGKSLTVSKEEEISKFIEELSEVDKVVSLKTKIIGTGNIRLSLEVELVGENIMDLELLKSEAEKIENGESPLKILVKSSERMVRATGHVIRQIEAKIHNQFPEVSLIDLEID